MTRAHEFKKILSVMDAVPEEKRFLVGGEYEDADGQCCIIGLLMPAELRPRMGGSLEMIVKGLVGNLGDEVQGVLDGLGVSLSVAQWLQTRNDNFGPHAMTPDEWQTFRLLVREDDPVKWDTELRRLRWSYIYRVVSSQCEGAKDNE